MKREATLLNIICVLAALGLLGLAAWNALHAGDFLTNDNLFLTAVCLLLALMFAINPLVSLHSSGKLPIPFVKRAAKTDEGPTPLSSRTASPRVGGAAAPPLLDNKGRPVPPDVRQIVDKMKQPHQEDA